MNEEYVLELYNYISGADETFQNDVSQDQFVTDMTDKQYAAQIYQYIGGLDESFKNDVDIKQFLIDIGVNQVVEEPIDATPNLPVLKKKYDLESLLGGGSSDLSEKPMKADNTAINKIFPNFTGEDAIPDVRKYSIGFDPDKYQPSDTRDYRYRDPVVMLGMYPEGGREALNEAYFMQQADIQFTAEQIKLEEPELLETQAAEQASRKAKDNEQIARNKDATINTEFQEALNATDKAKINLEENEAVPYFNDLYGDFGFTFRPVGVGDAMEASILLPNGELKKETIDLDPFFDSTAVEESEKLKNFVKKYAMSPDEAREKVESDFITAATRAKNLRTTPRVNGDGTESTVMFESGVVDGKYVVYPTIFPRNPEVQNTDPRYWDELEGMDAYEEAIKRNEVFIFKTDKEAKEFAEGSWKDVNNIDAEGQRFFQERGYDYLNIKKQYDAYENARDRFYFLEEQLKSLSTAGSVNELATKYGGTKQYSDLSEEEQELFGDLYSSTGYLRADAQALLEAEEKKFDELKDIYLDDDLQTVQEDFDVFIDKEFQKIRKESIIQNASAKYIDNELEAKSLAEFGVTIDELNNYTATNDEEAEMQDAILTSYKASQDVKNMAADKYEVSSTYLSGKFDENLRGELVDNYAAFQQQVDEGWYRGKAGNEILKMALGLEGDDEESTAQLAQRIVDYLDASNTEETSRAMGRWHRAKGFREAWDAFADNPAELALSFAANSINQMLPYGTKIIAGTTATGAGIGFGVGAVSGSAVGGVGAIPGGIAGAGTGTIWGLRTGFAATSYALEYTNAILDVARKEGYNINDPEDMKAALEDPDVWSKGNVRGAQRGIPIAVVDMLSSGLAGRVFAAGKTATFGRRLSVQLGERVVFDPFAEATGEFLAQANVGEGFEAKEIFAEALGGIGNNAPFAALNTALDLRAKNNTDIANDLTTIRGLNKELKGFFGPSPTRVSNWATNMEKLGQISTETNQRIQKNLGLRQDAQNVLDATQGRTSPEVLNRTMELMAAKQELESTTNRKQVFSGKLKEINAELNELAETKTVRPKIETATETQIQEGNTFEQGFQTNIAGIGLVDQTSATDIRENAKSKYTINGKSMKRSKFLSRINDMSQKQLNAANITIDNDEQVSKIVTDKFGTDAISKQETGTVPENQQTGDISTVEETVRDVQEQTTKPETTEESEVETLKDNQIPVKQQAFTYTDPNGETFNATITTNLDGSREMRLTDNEGTTFTTEKISKDNTLSNEEYLTNVAGDIQTTEEVDITTVRNPKTENKMSNRQRKAAGLPVKEEVSVEAETETIVVPKSINRPTKADVTAFDNNTIESTRLDRILAGIADKQIAAKPLTKFQQRVADKNQARIDEMVSSKTLTEEVSDLEETLQTTESKVDFKSEGKFVPDTDEVTQITTAINEQQSGNVETNLDETQSDVSIDVDELNNRTDTDINRIKSLRVINGVPVVFTISDQLTTGNVVNPLTGTTIVNLKGGLGFTGTEGNQELAWANTTDTEATTLIEKAKQVYEANKQIFEEFWAANPEYNGHVPMPVVKMGEGSILSNEATFRVFRDNLSKIPLANRKKALEALIGALEERITTRQAAIDSGTKTALTNKNYAKEIAGLKTVIDLIKKQNPETIDDVVSVEFLQQLNLPTRRAFLERLTYGQPNRAGTKKKTPSKGRKTIPSILIEGMEKGSHKLVHLGEMTDIITEPQLANVPQRSIIALQAIDVLNPEVLPTTHPNYPFGVKGKTIGILENPVSLTRAFPVAYQNAMEGLVKQERKRKVVTESQRKSATKAEREKMPDVGELAPASVGTILTETLGVQNGLPNLEFTGAISQGNVDNANKLIAFMNISFPQTNITTDKATFETVMAQENVQKYKKGDQTIYGVTVDGDVYINPDVHNSQSSLFNTSIHEMGHVWTDYLQTTKKGRTIYSKGVALVEQTEEFQRQLKRFNGDRAKAANETMAILIGNKGQTIADASVKSKFKEWLLGMWNYIKSQFKQTENLTAEEIQDLTLDEFIGSALADIFSGKKIKLTDNQLKKMKNPEVAFSQDLSIEAIVEKGRENGFSDASIREVLKGRGFKVAAINEAMTYQVDLFNELPNEFQRVEGGIQKAAQMFNDINVALQKFATSGSRNVIGRRRVRTFAEIREKAQELIQAHPTYKQQTDQVQMELRVGLDRSLGYRGNKNVNRQLSEIKKALRQRKIAVNNLQEIKTQLKNFIRSTLPKSKTYTQAQINSLIKAVNDIKKPEQLQRQIEKVTRLVDKQRAKMKRQVIADIVKFTKAKASTRKQSGKPRAKGLEGFGILYFKNAKEILAALSLTNPEARALAIENIKNDLEARQNDLVEAYDLMANNQELTAEQENLVQRQAAFDMFVDLETASLEEAQQILNDIKDVAKESILKMNNRRLQQQADAAALKVEVDNQIKETNSDLFNEDGTLKGEQQRKADQEAIDQNLISRGIRKVVDKLTDVFLGRTNSAYTRAKNYLTHLGTVTNFLDNKNKGLTIFTDKVYRKLNRTQEIAYQNMRSIKQKISDIAEEAGITGGINTVEDMLNSKLGYDKRGVMKTKKFTLKENVIRDGKRQTNTYTTDLNANQMLRIYSLYKNDVQREKLIAQGITPEVMAEMESILGPELTSFADKMVEYLSNEYFNEINSVYRQANGINLGFVENYFPTQTIRPKVDGNMLVDGNFSKVFNAETAPAFKDRIDYGSDVNLKDADFSGTLMNHFETMEKYKAYAMPVKEINSLFKIESLNVLLEETGMKQLMGMLVNASINPQSASQAAGMDGGGNIMTKLQTFFTGWALGLKLVQIAKQATSFVNAYSQYSYFPKNSTVPKAVQSAVDLVMFPIDLVGVLKDIAIDFIPGKEGAISKMRRMSATFDKRLEQGLEGDIYGLAAGSVTFKEAGKGTSLYSRIKRKVRQVIGAPTVIGDVLGVMGYYINYKRNIANGMSEAQALEAFNDYNATQQSRRNTEKIPLQLQGNFAFRAFTMFGSTLFLQINNVMQNATNMRRAIRDSVDGKSKLFGPDGIKKQDIRSFYLNAAVANALFVGVSNLALLTKGDKEDKEMFFSKIKEAMLGMNLLYQIPLVGSQIEMLYARWVKGERRKTDDIVNPLNSISRKVTRLMEKDNAMEKYVQPLAEIALGTQLDPVVALYNAVQEGVFGDFTEKEFNENIYDLLGITPSYRPGYGKKGSSVKGKIPVGGIKTKSDLKRYDPELYEKTYGKRDEIEKQRREQRKEILEKQGYKEVGGRLYKIDD